MPRKELDALDGEGAQTVLSGEWDGEVGQACAADAIGLAALEIPFNDVFEDINLSFQKPRRANTGPRTEEPRVALRRLMKR